MDAGRTSGGELTRCRTRLIALLVGAASITLAGCAATGNSGEQGIETSRSIGTDCFTVSLARDFRYLDDRNLIVFEAGRQPYHIELGATCMGLRGEFRIALRARGDRMCGFAGDAVILNDVFPQRCPVLSVTRLDENALQALLVGFEQAEPIVEGEVVELPPETED